MGQWSLAGVLDGWLAGELAGGGSYGWSAECGAGGAVVEGRDPGREGIEMAGCFAFEAVCK